MESLGAGEEEMVTVGTTGVLVSLGVLMSPGGGRLTQHCGDREDRCSLETATHPASQGS